MSLIYSSYKSLAMKPSDWMALAIQGNTVEVALPPPKPPNLPRGVKHRNAAVTAAAAEYRRICEAFPTRKGRRGKLKAIAQKYGIRKNAIATRVLRNAA